MNTHNREIIIEYDEQLKEKCIDVFHRARELYTDTHALVLETHKSGKFLTGDLQHTLYKLHEELNAFLNTMEAEQAERLNSSVLSIAGMASRTLEERPSWDQEGNGGEK
jgi:hypothetical protein